MTRSLDRESDISTGLMIQQLKGGTPHQDAAQKDAL